MPTSNLVLATFELECGYILREVPVVYKTWGKLNKEGTNVIVICHALSGSADVEGWWGPLLGAGRAFDPEQYFIFCGNVLGSPYGTASPVTINPDTGKAYGPEFPKTTIRDDVKLHKAVLDVLKVKQIQYVAGGSMGGMQVLEWAFFGKEYVQNLIAIATSARHSAWGIGWGEAQRQAIYSDRWYKDGYYSKDHQPTQGLRAARMTALLTYRSRVSFEKRFGRKVTEGVFSAHSYLRYQGDKFVDRFDANCYVAISLKLDTHDVSRGRGAMEQVLGSILQPTLVISIATDGLFTFADQYELSEHIPNAELVVIDSVEGHDGFLIEFQQLNEHLMRFITQTRL